MEPPSLLVFQRGFVGLIDQAVVTQGIFERVHGGGAVAQMQVAAPAFGKIELAGKSPDLAGRFIHAHEVGVHALRDIQPMFLADVSR